MNMNDKTKLLSIRLNEEQYNFIAKDSQFCGLKVSDYVRMLINMSMCTAKNMEEKLKEYENKKAD